MTGNNPNLVDLANKKIPSITKHTKFGQILSIRLKQILTSIKGLNSVTNKPKMMCNTPNQDLVNINAYTKLGKILSICSQDIERKQKLDIKSHNSVTKRKMTGINPNLNLVNINAQLPNLVKFYQLVQDIERKQNSDISKGL